MKRAGSQDAYPRKQAGSASGLWAVDYGCGGRERFKHEHEREGRCPRLFGPFNINFESWALYRLGGRALAATSLPSTTRSTTQS